MKSKKNEERKEKNKKAKNRSKLEIIVDYTEGFFLDFFDLIGLGKFVDWYIEKQEIMRYLVFGGLATVINIVAFAVLDKTGMQTLISNAIAWILSVIFAYFTNKLCIFYSKTINKKELAKEIISFVGCRIFTLIIDEAIMFTFVDKLQFNSILMKIIANIIVIILNFVFSKVLIFKGKQK